jgi:hypothetical protein
MTVLSRVTHVLCVASLLVYPVANAQAQSSGTQQNVSQSPALSNAKTPSLPVNADDDSSKDEPNLAERLLVSPREPRCADEGVVAGITVCGKKKDNTKDRLPIPGELQAATALGDGLPRAPDVMSNRITGHSIKFGSCFLGGCPPGMLPNIDFRGLPAAPEGSDADRVGKGEIRGT